MKTKKLNVNTRIVTGLDAQWARDREQLRSTLQVMATARQSWQMRHERGDDRLNLEDSFERLADMAQL